MTGVRKPDVELVPLTTRGRDLQDAAMVAARAFYDDPFFEYLEPHGVRRARALSLFWRVTIAHVTSGTRVTGARASDGRLVGVSVWVPPGEYPPPALNQVRTIAGASRAMALRPRALFNGLKYLLAIDKAHPRWPIWYLELLVVDPSVQRGGIGGLLQAEGMEAADKEGLECYLETQKESNVPYYGRFGYEVVQQLHPVKDGPPLWTLRRPAQ